MTNPQAAIEHRILRRMQALSDGSRLALPHVLLGSLAEDDVQPADISDGRDFEPLLVR